MRLGWIFRIHMRVCIFVMVGVGGGAHFHKTRSASKRRNVIYCVVYIMYGYEQEVISFTIQFSICFWLQTPMHL